MKGNFPFPSRFLLGEVGSIADFAENIQIRGGPLTLYYGTIKSRMTSFTFRSTSSVFMVNFQNLKDIATTGAFQWKRIIMSNLEQGLNPHPLTPIMCLKSSSFQKFRIVKPFLLSSICFLRAIFTEQTIFSVWFPSTLSTKSLSNKFSSAFSRILSDIEQSHSSMINLCKVLLKNCAKSFKRQRKKKRVNTLKTGLD